MSNKNNLNNIRKLGERISFVWSNLIPYRRRESITDENEVQNHLNSMYSDE